MSTSRLTRNYSRPAVARVNKKQTRGHGWDKLRVTIEDRRTLHLWWPPSYIPMMHGEVRKYLLTINNK